MPLNCDYPEILDSLKSELAPGRTESHAFLLWFLKNFLRLEETEAKLTSAGAENSAVTKAGRRLRMLDADQVLVRQFCPWPCVIEGGRSLGERAHAIHGHALGIQG